MACQHPRSAPQHPDELLFIIQHQTTELWFKLVLHELRAARSYLDADDISHARKALARVKHTFRTLAEQWSVLATLTPTEYAEFRGVLGSSSGFQSYQYRAVEFILGNKNETLLGMFQTRPTQAGELSELLYEPTLYDAFMSLLSRGGHEIPREVLDRDRTRPWCEVPALFPALQRIYEDTTTCWAEYALCEDLVDLEDAFQFWRFRHLRTVQRTIGLKAGTGGSSGVEFLRRALDLTFFPELYSIRARIGT